ncbi:MAG TPA: hypothetical protein VIZ43_06350 [Trebonia sp.]
MTAIPMTSEAMTVAHRLRTQVPIHSAVVPATIAISTESRTTGTLYDIDIDPGMIIPAMPM